MTTSTKNHSAIVDTCKQRIEGLNEHVPAKTEIDVAGKSMTLAQVTSIYQATLDAQSALKSKRAAAKVAFEEWKAAEATCRSTDKALKGWVANKFGPSSQEAQDIGFPPPKATKLKTEAALLKTQRLRATREARGTMGKKERLKIKGTVPSTAPTASAPNPAPVAQATPAPEPASTATTANGAASH
jgi:hypothetical protein